MAFQPPLKLAGMFKLLRLLFGLKQAESIITYLMGGGNRPDARDPQHIDAVIGDLERFGR